MASLIFAATYFTYDKIKTKREEKKEKKRRAYADRYSELERAQRAHVKDVEKQSQSHAAAGGNQTTAEQQSSSVQSAEVQARRRSSSSESLRSNKEKTDGPGAWVDEVLRDQSKGGTQSLKRASHEETKMQSLI